MGIVVRVDCVMGITDDPLVVAVVKTTRLVDIPVVTVLEVLPGLVVCCVVGEEEGGVINVSRDRLVVNIKDPLVTVVGMSVPLVKRVCCCDVGGEEERVITVSTD
jgi:hypothetical protein